MILVNFEFYDSRNNRQVTYKIVIIGRILVDCAMNRVGICILNNIEIIELFL